MAGTDTSRQTAVERALNILEPPRSAATDLPILKSAANWEFQKVPPATSRTLERRGYLRRDAETARYRLG